tara:strand:- start:113 stop:610 length:498 start_codon:yes stop_codon:yes gene_type:complete
MKDKRTFFKQSRTLLVVLFAITAPFLLNAEESAQDGLQRCGLIGDMSARLTCYDQLGRYHNSATAKVGETIDSLPDEKYLELLTSRNEQLAEPVSVIVKVMKCIKSGGSNKYHFYLEGGQVWKQTSDKRLGFKDCNFGVSIIKDYFGYKMQLEDSKKKFRVKRIR